MKNQWFVASKDDHNGVIVTLHVRHADAFHEYKKVMGGLMTRRAWGKCPANLKTDEIEKHLGWGK